MQSLNRFPFLFFVLAVLVAFPCACANGPVKNTSDGTDKLVPEKTVSEKKNVEVKVITTVKGNKEDGKKPGEISNTLMPVVAVDVKVEMKAYNGELRLVSLIKPGTPVKKGDLIAKLDAPDLENAIADTHKNLQSQELSYRVASEEFKRVQKTDKLKLERAQHTLKIAEESLAKWEKEERADRKRSSEINLERLQFSIEDQKEELAQLDRLYKGNELAKESQDIVLNRARRSLKQTEERLEMSKRSHARLLKYELPRQDMEKKLAVDSARETLKKIQVAQLPAISHANNKTQLADMEITLRKTKKRLADLEKDKGSLTIIAPIDGFAVAGPVAKNPGVESSLKPGDRVNKETAIAGVMDMSAFKVTVQVPAKDAVSIEKGTLVQVKVKAFELALPGIVQACGIRAKDDKVAVMILVKNDNRKLIPGLSVTVDFPKE